MDGLQKLIDAVDNKIYELEGNEAPITTSSKILSETKATLEQIMNDPDVELGDADKDGNQEVFCCGKSIGLINAHKGICEIDSKKYKLPQKSNASIKSSTVMASINTRSELEDAIRDALDSDICRQVVEDAFSSNSMFEKEIFMESDTFFETELINDTAKEVALKFHDGEDLDDDGPADPTKKYFRLTKKGNVESTDYPGDIYFDTLEEEIIGYIMDNLEDVEFPDYIQEIVDEYLDNNAEE